MRAATQQAAEKVFMLSVQAKRGKLAVKLIDHFEIAVPASSLQP
jgi:hypothetical protein